MFHTQKLRFLLILLTAVLLVGCGASNTGDDPSGGDDTSTSSTSSSSGADMTGSSSSSGMDTMGSSSSGMDTMGSSSSGMDTSSSGGGDYTDADADGIADQYEGDDSVDSDGDGTADYLDADSDGDGIPDSVEGGNANLASEPVDSDGDGTPDYLDDDSDDNGISDAIEGTNDGDGDALGDYRDWDNDGDGVSDTGEITGSATSCPGTTTGTTDAPVDYDGDGVPDYQDPDNDGDTIADRPEGADTDTDGDGCPDRFDDDSDGDTIPDSTEAGDDDLSTPPVYNDDDLIPDFQDPDSDNDGLSDDAEVNIHGTSPTSSDSDNDGTTDLIEIAAGTDPNNTADNPSAQGDFFFLVPYGGQQSPEVDTLSFGTNFQQADAYFLIDNSGTMSGEIAAMHDAVVDIVNTLTCQPAGGSCVENTDCSGGAVCSLDGFCIEDPSVTGCIPSFWTGAGVYAGADATPLMTNLQNLTSNATSTTNAIPTTADGLGAQEGLFMSVECSASGTGGRCPTADISNCTAGGIGCPGFRSDAVRILVVITDEPNQDTDTSYTAAATATALNANDVNFIGIDAVPVACTNTCTYSNDNDCDDGGPNSDFSFCTFGTDCGDCGTRNLADATLNADLIAIASASGSLDSTGQPFVRPGDASLLVGSVKDAINEIVNNVPIRVTIEAVDLPGDDGDASPFLDHLVVNISGSADCEFINQTEDTGLWPGYDDAFPTITPGQQVCWDVVPVFNNFHPATAEPQVFNLQLTVRGNGAILDQRTVYFLVPPQGVVLN